mgnify:FL=1|jgi:hypothetical protein
MVKEEHQGSSVQVLGTQSGGVTVPVLAVVVVVVEAEEETVEDFSRLPCSLWR